eukprot:COSAG05_NODE_16401_length_347_cov_0.576613_1_plen_33_part_01
MIDMCNKLGIEPVITTVRPLLTYPLSLFLSASL